MTFAEYRTAVLANVFPDGYSNRVLWRYTSWLKDFLIEIQKNVPYLQTAHKELIPQSATVFSCGLSGFTKPSGRIVSFHTELACNGCDKVRAAPYTPHRFRMLLEERNRPNYTNSDGTCRPCDPYDTTCLDIRNEPYGFYEYDGSTLPYPSLADGVAYATSHIDSSCRSLERAFTVYDGRVWTWPVINSTEIGVLRWHGIKRNWIDADQIPWKDEGDGDMREIQELAELFINWKAKMFDDCDDAGASSAKGLYDSKMADFIVSQRQLHSLPDPEDALP